MAQAVIALAGLGYGVWAGEKGRGAQDEGKPDQEKESGDRIHKEGTGRFLGTVPTLQHKYDVFYETLITITLNIILK